MHTSEQDELDAQARRDAGFALMRHLQSLYALKRPMTACHFAVACHYCKVACVPGADWEPYALPPGLQSGRYQQELDRVLPPPKYLDNLEVPCSLKYVEQRTTCQTTVSIVHEAIEDEVQRTPDILEKVESTHWP